MCNRGSIYFAIAPPTLLPIAGTLGGSGTAAAGIEYVGVYLAIAISIHVNIVCKRVTDIAKDI